ncbi:ChaN family lipoprotein [Steroidobacter sp.]|uniref:ChaN family lipoprotein n=1 Tax=Steroidobacter sp. TaxID=1978227 RepID=UPI001A3AB474|nr:ChaN family lipoprotein [Steroidobacter sp.]MBL8268342.1 ChaN family lipoprotein [Steroidobacter sp.]
MRLMNTFVKWAALWLMLAGSAAAYASTPLADAEAQRLATYLKEHGATPEQYILSKVKRYDVVLLGEEHRVKHNLELAHRLIPQLYQAGVYNFGMEFGASEDQAALDALVTGERYDESVARRLMFNYNVGWVFKEYMDIYRVAWAFNRSLPVGARKFRILNLSYKFNWDGFNGVGTPDNMQRVFPKGDTERYRVDLIQREVLSKGDKILILTGTGHAYTRYTLPVNDYLSEGFYRLEDRSMGNLLYRLAPGKVFNILLHRPFYSQTGGPDDLVQPAGGALEQVMAKRRNAPVGFDLVGTPLGELRDDSYFAIGHQDFRLHDLADGYVFVKPLRAAEACTIDEKFLTEQNWLEAQRQHPAFPDLSGRPKSLEAYWRSIREYADIPKIYRRVR